MKKTVQVNKLIGNPQFGKADSNKPLPLYYFPDGNKMEMSICPDCGGYYLAQCPCWFFKGGRYHSEG